jgi:hypothetical protein
MIGERNSSIQATLKAEIESTVVVFIYRAV